MDFLSTAYSSSGLKGPKNLPVIFQKDKGLLKVLNDSILILNDHSDSFRINVESFKTQRYLSLQKNTLKNFFLEARYILLALITECTILPNLKLTFLFFLPAFV